MENSDGLVIAEEKLVEALSFTSIPRAEIVALLKALVSSHCESAHIVWSNVSHHAELDAGIIWDEQSHRRSKVVGVNAKIDKISVQKDFEFSEGKFWGFRFQFVTPRS